jgi:hypothetical protein
VFIDGTHIKASANKRKFVKKVVYETSKDYLETLDAAITEDRKQRGKKPLKARRRIKTEKEIKESVTDPKSGYMYRTGKPFVKS